MNKIGNSIFQSRKNVDDFWLKFWDLSGAKVCKSYFFRQKSPKCFRDWIIEFPIFFIFCIEFCFFSANFWWFFFPDFAPNSSKEWRVSLFQSNLRKQIRKLPKFLKFVKIFQNYSLLFIIILFQSVAAKKKGKKKRKKYIASTIFRSFPFMHSFCHCISWY